MNREHHSVKNGHIDSCQVCDSKNLHLILDLGHQPLSDTLLTKEMLNQPETMYPLRMFWCQDCTLVQIDYCVDKSTVFHPDYPYRTGITKELAEYLHEMSKNLISKCNLQKGDLVADIGSNDGTLLDGFKKEGMKVLGVEPTNVAKIANENGIDTVQEFFTVEVANKIKEKYGEASMITATNMFAHMSTMEEVILAIEALLKDGGVFISESHYLLDVIQKGQFDTIYHEHLRTYTLKSLIKLFSYYNFTVTDVQRGDRYGGNIRVYVTKGKELPVSENVAKLLKEEEEAGLDKLETYVKFADRAKKAKKDFVNFILKLKAEGKSVVGNSCPARSVTLLNYYGIDKEFIPYLAEQPTSLKLNLYLPGKHMPVVNNQRLIEEQPDYVIILAWHYAEPIIEQLKERGLKSKFIIPLPDFKLVD